MKIDQLDFEFRPHGTGGERSPGVHVSQIVKSIMQILAPKRFDPSSGLNWEKITAGWAWEEALGAAFVKLNHDVIQQFGELERDGITGTPDAYNPSENALEEYKATWASAKRDITDDLFYHWHLQTQAYLHMAGLDTVIFRVFFVNGHYQHPYDPCWKSWRITYEPRELENNWAMLMRHAVKKGWL